MRRIECNRMNGLLIIDKPAGMTSHDVVARARRVLATRRVGHTGTLDPFATGVMVLLVGNATRLARFVDKDEKEYEALVQFGSETDSGDVTGVRSAECGMRDEEVEQVVATADWELVFGKFRGGLMQTPPMYSAKKIDGKKLYELARKGIEVERKPVRVTIHKLELIEDAIRNPQSAIRIRVVCSAGTYIRTLAEDIGRELGPGAHLTELRRTRAGRFSIAEAVTLEQFEKTVDPAALLKPVSEAVSALPQMTVPADRSAKTRSGLSSRFEMSELADGGAVKMVDEQGELIAIGSYDANEKIVNPKIVLV